MTDPVYLLDPAIEEILRDIASDPQSTLLRVQRPKELRDLSLRRQEASARAAGWSSAERKLLECYRDEVAFLLRYQYFVRFVNNDRFEALRELRSKQVYRGIPQDEVLIQSRIEHEAGQLREAFPKESTTSLVEACLGLSKSPDTVPMQLAAASLRLVPSEAGRIYMGSEYMYGGASRSAQRVFHHVADEACTPRLAMHGLSAAGEAYALSGQLELALEAYERAAELVPDAYESLFCALGVAAEIGRLDVMMRAGGKIDERFQPDSPEVSSWPQFLRGLRERGLWSPSSITKQHLCDCRDTLGPVSRVILSAYL